ncbi:MAG: PLP-dependent transferase [Acidobacteriota bacterium]|nr:MAG: PLP-dependent transferase [Acidobacteriota bacterium]
MKKSRTIETDVVHAGVSGKRVEGAVVMPVFQSSTYEYTGQQSYEDLRYIRLNNTPAHRQLHRKLAALEQGEAALVTSSGMAAITATLLSLLSSGDHLLAQDCLYGGTTSFLSGDLPALGIGVDFIDGQRPEQWEALLKPETRAIYVESITNPLVQVGELKSVVEFARRHQLTAIIDNTFASPVNFRPLEQGFDLVVHSCTKYLNGHSDLVAGAVIGSAELVEGVNHKSMLLGGCLDPHACFLLERGIKTLVLRVRHQNRSAEAIARFLASRPEVAKVNHPLLNKKRPSDGTQELFAGFGGMLSFELHGDAAVADAFIRRLEIPIEAPSLGGVETLITRPATTSHLGWTPEERAAVGISDSLMRMSVGIEGTEDLIDDLDRALKA